MKLQLAKEEIDKCVACSSILVIMNKLTRIQFGPLDLKGLNAGEGRVLTPHEVKTLRHLGGKW